MLNALLTENEGDELLNFIELQYLRF